MLGLLKNSFKKGKNIVMEPFVILTEKNVLQDKPVLNIAIFIHQYNF